MRHCRTAGKTVQRTADQAPPVRRAPEGPEGLAAVPMSDDGDTYQKFRMQFDCINFQQSPETLQFQRCQFKY